MAFIVSIIALFAACEANKVLEAKGSFLDLAPFECDSCVQQQQEEQQEGNPLIGKDVFVIDNNFGHILCGFVGDATPSIDAQLEYDGGYLHESPVWESVKEEWANLFPADIRGRDVLMTVHPKTSDKNKENIADIMFGTFGVANLFLIYRQELAIKTGTIIDIDTKHHELSVVAVYDGVAIDDAVKFAVFDGFDAPMATLESMVQTSMEMMVDEHVRNDVTAKYLVMTDMESVPDCVCMDGMEQAMNVKHYDEYFVWSHAFNLFSDDSTAMPWVSMIDYQRCGASVVHTLCHVDPRQLFDDNGSTTTTTPAPVGISNVECWYHLQCGQGRFCQLLVDGVPSECADCLNCEECGYGIGDTCGECSSEEIGFDTRVCEDGLVYFDESQSYHDDSSAGNIDNICLYHSDCSNGFCLFPSGYCASCDYCTDCEDGTDGNCGECPLYFEDPVKKRMATLGEMCEGAPVYVDESQSYYEYWPAERCYSHSECSNGFCLANNYCASCDHCEDCEEGVDGNCGACPLYFIEDAEKNNMATVGEMCEGGIVYFDELQSYHDYSDGNYDDYCHSHSDCSNGFCFILTGHCASCDHCTECTNGLNSNCGECPLYFEDPVKQRMATLGEMCEETNEVDGLSTAERSDKIANDGDALDTHDHDGNGNGNGFEMSVSLVAIVCVAVVFALALSVGALFCYRRRHSNTKKNEIAEIEEKDVVPELVEDASVTNTQMEMVEMEKADA